MCRRHRLRLSVLPDLYAISRLEGDAAVPSWASSDGFWSITRTADELSVVCREHLVPDGIRCQRDWRCLRVAGAMDFSMVGVVSSLVTPLAEAGLSVFVVSTFDTDHLLVKDSDVDAVTTALSGAGHTLQ
jgi:hypothetical protein